MEHPLKIKSEVVEGSRRTRVITGRRSCNIFIDTTVEDRGLVSYVKNIKEPDAKDLTDREILDTVAEMYGFKEWPCKAVILDRINVIPAGIITNYCHTSPENRIATGGNKPEIEIVSTVETGIHTKLESAKGKSVVVKGNTLTIVSDEITMLVTPTNPERDFTDKEEMLKQASVRDVSPIVREAEVKNQ